MNEDYRGYSTPLLDAIHSQSDDAVKTLLQSGSDPNGVSLYDISLHAAGFLRFGPSISEGSLPDPYLTAIHTREQILTAIGRQQISAITQGEVEDRFEDCVGKFWTEPLLRPLAQIPRGDAVPAVVEAAQRGSIEVIDLLIDNGADVSFWLSRQTGLPVPATVSSLAITTPLHSAIWSRNTGVLKHLLSCGFNPNAMPLAAITRCITPAMATISYCDPWNQAAWECLQKHPAFDPGVRTPIFDVHILHFAAAKLSLPLLKAIVEAVPLADAGTTALGHTMLHIVCLPLDERFVNWHSEPVYRSVHETRDLSELSGALKARFGETQSNDYSTARDILDENDLSHSTFASPETTDHLPASSTESYFPDQIAIIQYLYECNAANISKQDVHGNTALHYLASHCSVNHQLVTWLRSQDQGQQAWGGLKNRYGFTAQDILSSNEVAVRNPKGQPFWHSPDLRYRKNLQQEEQLRAMIEDRQYAILQRRM